MQAGPEGHARVEGQDDVIGLAPVAPPGRADDDPPAHAQDREVRLPGVGPVRLLHEARLEFADRAQAERLEVTQVARDIGDGRVGGRPIAAGT